MNCIAACVNDTRARTPFHYSLKDCMHHIEGHVATPEASRYLVRLCYHWSRKIAVEYDEHQGLANFPWGSCQLRADAQALHFACSAATPEELARIQLGIDEHVKLFSRKAPMAVQWQNP